MEVRESIYKCLCGKEFNNPNSYMSHCANCKDIYLAKYGNLDKYNEHKKNNAKSHSISAQIKKAEREQLNQIEKQKQLEQWLSEQHTCKNCGKVMTEKYGSGIFCSGSCRAIYTNKHRKSVDIICEICGRHFSSKQGYTLHRKIEAGEKVGSCFQKSKLPKYKVCAECGKHFNRINRGQYYDNGLGYGTKFCSLECKKIHTHNALSKKAKQSFADGRNIGFISRDKLSFPEKFWIKVLDNNNIKYEHNYTVSHTPTNICKGSWFSLDFYIIKNDLKIDLEIDGKQHKYSERKIFDAERDYILTGLGYNIYRIPVDNYDSRILKEKVDNFLNWYNSL